MTTKHFTAAKALLVHGDKVLLLRESTAYQDGLHSGRYDVPGGRLEPDETLQDGLTREVMEETGLSFTSADLFYDDHITVEKNGETWHIHRHYFACAAVNDKVTTSTDHDGFIWIDPQDYAAHNIIPKLHEIFKAYLTYISRTESHSYAS